MCAIKNSSKNTSKSSFKKGSSHASDRALKVKQLNDAAHVVVIAEAKKSNIDLPANFKEYASFDRRLIATTIDVLLLVLLSIPLNKFLEIVLFGGKSSSQAVIDVLNNVSDTVHNQQIIQVLKAHGLFYKLILIQISSLLLMWMYCIFLWMHMNATVGKYIMKLKIITPQNKVLGFWRCNLRFFSYIPSVLFVFIGFFWIYFNKERRAWHDYIASTRVVYCPTSTLRKNKK